MRHPFFDLPHPVVIGHRGCAGETPENTLPSFARALDQGAVILETDVHVTRDGVPVLLHDPRVDRVSEAHGRVTELLAAELAGLDAGHGFTPDGGRSHPFRGAGLTIPTLAEAFAEFPGARFNIEIKLKENDGVAQTLSEVKRSGRESVTLLTAGEDAVMADLRAQLAQIDEPPAQGACTADVLAFLKSMEACVPPPPGPMALQVPTEFGGRPLVTEAFVTHAHAHGLAVHVWTVNEPHAMSKLLDLGVDGIVTDSPGRLAELLTRRVA